MKVRLLAAIIIGLTASHCWAEQAPKIGVLNVQKVLMESDAGKKVQSDLTAKDKLLQDKVNQRKTGFEKAVQDFKKKEALLSGAAKDEKQKELEKEYVELQKMVAESNRELQETERTANEPLLANLQKVVEKFAQEQGYTLILDARAALYNSVHDITDPILRLYNEENKATLGSGTPVGTSDSEAKSGKEPKGNKGKPRK